MNAGGKTVEVVGESQRKVAYDYAKYPREFVSYRWFKPLLVGVLGVVIYFALMLLLLLVVAVWTGGFGFLDNISTGYDDMNVFTGPTAMVELGTIALMLPALALAGLIVRDRPFSSYSTSRGGWNWKAFAFCLAIAAAVMFADIVIETLIGGSGGSDGDGIVRFTAVGVVLCAVLIPLQCIAEEYVFRGFIIQTIGSWTKLPVVAIIVSAAIFAAGHPYNAVGVVCIFINGIFFGILAWKTAGLEASCALHIVNNTIAFVSEGLGLSTSTSEIPVEAVVVIVLIDVVYTAAVLVLGKRFGWFAPKGDGTAKFNRKKQEKLARKQQGKHQGGHDGFDRQGWPEPPVPSMSFGPPAPSAHPVPPAQRVYPDSFAQHTCPEPLAARASYLEPSLGNR